MTDVSIIIPTFNRLWSLPQAIDSCRGNDCNTEIIVIDDGSTDGTWEWLKTVSDVMAIRQENWGKDWAVNKAIGYASGNYIRFLDSDDWLAPKANDRQLSCAKASDADVVVAGHVDRNELSGTDMIHEWVSCDDFVAQQLGECLSGHYSAYLIRRSFVLDIPHRQEFGARDDRMFVIELACKKPRIAHSDGPVLFHRHHHLDRLQERKGEAAIVRNRQLLAVYKKAIQILNGRGELTLRRKRAAIKVLWPLAHWIACSHPVEGRNLASWIYQLDPEFVPPEPGALGFLYRCLGFGPTENILRWRRRMLAPLRPRTGDIKTEGPI